MFIRCIVLQVIGYYHKGFFQSDVDHNVIMISYPWTPGGAY